MKRLLLFSLLAMTVTLFGCMPTTTTTNIQSQPAVNSVPINAPSSIPNENKLDLSNQGLTQVSQDIFKQTNPTT